MKLNSKIVSLCFPARCVGCCREISPFDVGHFSDSSVNSRFASRRNIDNLNSSRRSEFDSVFDAHWCRDCWSQLSANAIRRCHTCGANLYHRNLLGDRCSLCHGVDLRFERAIATGNYRGLLQDLVIRMKNQHDEQIAIQLGTRLASELKAADFLNEVDRVVPVPTHWWRRVRRGFQAAEVVAETVAAMCDLPYAGQAMRCLRATKKQGTLTTAGRFKNVRGAFDVRPNVRVNGLNILLVDDVMTSCATASEMARMLKASGAAKVYVGVIARGARVS